MSRKRAETEKRKSLDLIARFARDTHPHMGPALAPWSKKISKEHENNTRKGQNKSHIDAFLVSCWCLPDAFLMPFWVPFWMPSGQHEQRRPNQSKDAHTPKNIRKADPRAEKLVLFWCRVGAF